MEKVVGEWEVIVECRFVALAKSERQLHDIIYLYANIH